MCISYNHLVIGPAFLPVKEIQGTKNQNMGSGLSMHFVWPRCLPVRPIRWVRRVLEERAIVHRLLASLPPAPKNVHPRVCMYPSERHPPSKNYAGLQPESHSVGFFPHSVSLLNQG